MVFFLGFLIALMATMVLIPPLMRKASALNALDIPDARKVHQTAVPRVGGIAMVTGALLAFIILVPVDTRVAALLAGILVLLAFGIWDDRSDLDFRLKLLGQIVAVTIVVGIGHIVIERIPFGGLDSSSPVITIPFTIFCLVGVTNAINLADGLDGLAAGISLLSLAAIAILAYIADGDSVVLLAMAVIGCVLGFLRYNTHPARIFMGDTGSQFLGFGVGVLSIWLTQYVNPAMSAILPLLLLGFPILDMTTVVIQRIREKRSPFSPDKNHIHHKLLALGFDHYEAVIIIYLIHSSLVLSAVFLRYESDFLLATLFLSICAAVLLMLYWAARSGWRAHQRVSQSFFHRAAQRARSSRWADQVPAGILHYLVPLLFVGSVTFASDVPADLGIGAMFLFFPMLARLVFGYRLWFLFLRLMMFLTAGFVVYLTGIYTPGTQLIPRGTEYVIYGVILGALLMGIRYSNRDVFRVTPTDFLLVILVLGLAAIPEDQLVEWRLVPSIVKTAVLFYAIEFVLGRMKSRWNFFTAGMLSTIGILAIRGYF